MVVNALEKQKKMNIVWIKQPKVPFAFLKKMNNYHMADYNLYWFNVRENAANRTKQYLKQKKEAN